MASEYSPCVLKLRNCNKAFDNGDIKVLQNFSMSVPKGTLYSLIGSSGCGKTTVLSCIVGTKKLESGKILIFGNENVSTQLHRMGYMPQETSLYERLSILENLLFFGMLFNGAYIRNTSHRHLMARVQFLTDLLKLPPSSRIVGTLSGGQRRRVSFAVSIMHEPELLLLDEPTCGVDSLIRERIWEYMKLLVREKGTSIILTTHYIDEAKHSDVVGVMRDGKLIAEQEPASLQADLGESCLENAFLSLCRQQRYILCSRVLPQQIELEDVTIDKGLASTESNWNLKMEQLSPQRILQLSSKNFKILIRNVLMLSFILIVPAICILSICNAFSNEVSYISLGLVDPELRDIAECFGNSTDCDNERLSCYFIRALPKRMINLISFETEVEARKAADSGTIWGYISFPRQYSNTITNIMLTDSVHTTGMSQYEEEVMWNNTKISVRLDQTNTIIYSSLVNTLYDTFEKGFKNALKSCGFDERHGEFPLQYGDPLVGKRDLTVLDYVAPGLAVCFLYFLPSTVSLRFINEKRQGTLERCLAGGTSILQILVSYFSTEFFLLVVQSLLVHFIMRYGYSVGSFLPISNANFVVILLLSILQGVGGVAYGCVLGVLCPEESHAAMIIIATMLPYAFMSGIIWPVEGMPYILQKICMAFPLTLPAEALRSMMNRGWDITFPVVLSGFGVTIGYIVIFSGITIIICRKSKK